MIPNIANTPGDDFEKCVAYSVAWLGDARDSSGGGDYEAVQACATVAQTWATLALAIATRQEGTPWPPSPRPAAYASNGSR
jgi:hypothetical protein